MMSSQKRATTQEELRNKVIKFAISSRFVGLLLSAVSNAIIPDHEASGVYRFPLPKDNETSPADRVINIFLGGLARWDAQYFLHISHYGYTFENILAFFPLFPYLSRILARCLEFSIGSSMNPFSMVLLSSVAVNFIFFVGAASKLFQLSCAILQDDQLAYIASLFFCINPASIFFTAPYSESCFSFFSFSGMLFCSKYESGLISSFAFGLSACARSNGILNIGFVAWKTLKIIIEFINNENSIFRVIKYIYVQLLQFLVLFIIFLMPFALFQSYLYLMFCLKKATVSPFLMDFGKSKALLIPGTSVPPWCNFTIPVSYSYVQSHYWNVGFLRYYELKQIPNFLLALPIIYLVLNCSYKFMMENHVSLMTMGLSNRDFNTFCGRRVHPECFVFVTHAVALTVFCLVFVHVQVTTRMMASSSPVLYWYVAFIYQNLYSTASDRIQSRLQSFHSLKKYSLVETRDNLDSFWKTIVLTEAPSGTYSKVLIVYFCSYFVIGTALFSNYFPWT